jgi:hypothetical protein
MAHPRPAAHGCEELGRAPSTEEIQHAWMKEHGIDPEDRAC